jgi:hypothetical protein
VAFERCKRRPSSPTAGDPCSGACTTRAYAVPRAAAGAYGRTSTPTCVRTSGRDADTNGAALGHPATSGAGDDTIVDFDTKAGTRIAGTATRGDLPSKREAACAVSLAVVAAIATAAMIAALESKIVLIAATFDDE